MIVYTREEYFQKLNQWKDDYKKLSNEIRQTKKDIKTADWINQAYHQSKLEYPLRHTARQMMEERAELKEIAKAHWLSQNECRLSLY